MFVRYGQRSRWLSLGVCRIPVIVAGSAAIAGLMAPLQLAKAQSLPVVTIETGVHSAIVRRLAVAEDRARIVTASDDKTARIWDIDSGRLLTVLRPHIGPGEIGRLYGAAIHPVEDLVAVGGTTGSDGSGHRILLYSLSQGMLRNVIDARGGDIKQLAWSADGSVLLAIYAGDNALRAFDRRGTMIYHQPFSAPSLGLTVSRDGMVAASSLDGHIILVDVKDGRVLPVRTIRTSSGEPVGLAFAPGSKKLVVGYLKPNQPPEVLDLATGRTLFKLALPKLEAGMLTTVAWSKDGREIAATGSGYTARRKFPIFFHDGETGRLTAQQDVARDTVFDIAPIRDGGFVYASADGTWGRVTRDRLELAVESAVPQLKGPENLYVSPDGSRVAWMNFWGQDPASFDFSRRLVAVDAAGANRDGMFNAKSRRTRFESSEWQDTRTPKINGKSIALGKAEISRALAYFVDGGQAILGTSHRLLRIDEDGKTVWSVHNAGEVWSVNVTRDGRMAITGMSDGTIRWWRASDGSPLLTLLAARDGRWVAWTPEGYFDASAGADRLVGWALNRPDGQVADYFSLNRFRERFNRPDLIDQVLQKATPLAALDAVRAVSRATGAPNTAPALSPPGGGAVAGQGAAAHASMNLSSLLFPPVLGPVDIAALKPAPGDLVIPVAVKADGDVELEVRVDGRPVSASAEPLPVVGGERTTTATLAAPEPGALVQVIAKNANGVSEPLGFVVERIEASQAGPILRPVPSVPEPSVKLGDSAPSRPAPQQPRPPSLSQPRLFVLAIGISEYQRPEYRLGLAAKDARDFAEAMRQQRGKLYREVQTRALVNREATRLAINANLKWLSDMVGPGDIGMLFLAGHGMNATGGQYYFLPYEGAHDRLPDTGLPEAAIRNTLGRMRGKALFFVDTCFGGNVVGNLQTASRELSRLANDLAAAENGVVVFASSSGRQVSEENDAWGNGAFTKAVLEGISGGADLTRTGRITFKGLDFYISEEVRKLTDGRQTPVTISPLGIPDFAIARAGTT